MVDGMDSTDWKDITSYSRGEKGRVPGSFQRTIGQGLSRLVITVTRHIDFDPSVWVLTTHGILAIPHRELDSKDIASAKVEATHFVRDLLDELRGAL
jgi:hypothetical protein